MTTRNRDRFLVLGAVLLVVATSGLVLFTMRQAERNGTRALEQMQVAQVLQLTRSMDSRVKSSFDGFQGFIDAPPAWTAGLRDPSDRKRLDQLQSLSTKARTGMLIVDRNGVVTNGTLLRDPTLVGRKVALPGLDDILAGTPAYLPVSDGLTTARQVITIGFPLRNAAKELIGAFLLESDVSTESAFQAEVATLKRGRTGQFSFVDGNGVVVASSDPSRLGLQLADPLIADGHLGVHRGEGRIAVVEAVPTIGWRTVFQQDFAEFSGGLTKPLHSALVYLVIAGALIGGISVIMLARRLRGAREQQRRLEAIHSAREDFVSIVSHELRTPISGLLGFLGTTVDNWDAHTDDGRRRAVTRALSSAKRLQAMTREVLEASEADRGSMSYEFNVIEIASLVDEVTATARDLHPDRMFVVTSAPGAVLTRVDTARMGEVFVTLLENAVQASPALSPIEIRLTTLHDQVAVEVTDHGLELSDTDLGRAFDKFVRGRGEGHGTGLGLYLAQGIVAAHGGRISAANASGGGATFTVWLPAVSAPVSGTTVPAG